MQKPIFKIGDSITAAIPRKGIDYGVITKIDKDNYYLSIMNGVAIIPIKAQAIYKLIDKK